MNTPNKNAVTGERTAARRLKFGRWGLAEDARHLHCVLNWQGRELLGEITDAFHDPVLSCTRLEVRHFNGEPWPIKPAAAAVRILG
jgi:hypothetical protein